ncbi:MAG: type VI secretion system baseplate subunit TssE [Pirellula sp.]
MAELTQKERLQPSLLDRLTDDSPTERNESRDARVLSLKKLRECVLRDLSWLLNTESLESVVNLDTVPAVKTSVLNFGIPAVAGVTASGLELSKLERQVRNAIILYEPRLLKEKLTVKALLSDEQMSRNTLVFEINGELWAQPVPLRMHLRTELDLETGKVSIMETNE